MTEALEPSQGWAVLHLFGTVDERTDAEGLRQAVKAASNDDHQVVNVAVLGHKADIGFVALGPDVRRLRAFQTAVRQAGVSLTYSYVSLTELSEYAAGVPDAHKEARLHPQLPPEGKAAFCFYPMSKRRAVEQNWYELPFDDRKELMYEHGASGRTFAGRIVQLVTGSTGLDDFEWGVTLFGLHPDDLKACVYTMRYDRASARFAEFGPFYTGVVGTLDDVLAEVGLT